jgi:GntR family transcriptional regulator
MKKEVKTKIPLYINVYEQIYSMINKGEFKPGEKLPSETELAKLLDISRGTLRQALLLLQEDNIIFNYQGKGNFVTNNQEVTKAGIEGKSNIAISCNIKEYTKMEIDISFQMPTTKHQKELNVDASKLLAVIDIDYYVGEEQACYMLMFIPYDIVSAYNVNLNDKDEVYKFIINFIDKNVLNMQSKISIINPREKLIKKFNLLKEESLFVFDEVYYSELGVPVISVKTYCLPKFFKFNLNRK